MIFSEDHVLGLGIRIEKHQLAENFKNKGLWGRHMAYEIPSQDRDRGKQIKRENRKQSVGLHQHGQPEERPVCHLTGKLGEVSPECPPLFTKV